MLHSLQQLTQLTTLALGGQFTCNPRRVMVRWFALALHPRCAVSITGDTFSGNTPSILPSLQGHAIELPTLSIGGELTACTPCATFLKTLEAACLLIPSPDNRSGGQSFRGRDPVVDAHWTCLAAAQYCGLGLLL